MPKINVKPSREQKIAAIRQLIRRDHSDLGIVLGAYEHLRLVEDRSPKSQDPHEVRRWRAKLYGLLHAEQRKKSRNILVEFGLEIALRENGLRPILDAWKGGEMWASSMEAPVTPEVCLEN